MASGLLSLKWNNHRSTFFHILSTVRTKETYADVSLACEGKLYPVHKLVLSTCSEYFEEMFSHVDCKHPIIVLKDIKGDELEALLNYMYIGEVNVMQDNLAGLIKAAECLKIKGLAVPDEAPEPMRDAKRNVRRIEESPQPKRRRREEPPDIEQSPEHYQSASSDSKSSYREPRVSDSSSSRHVNSSENSVSRPNKIITPQKDTSREKDRDLNKSNDSASSVINPKQEALPPREDEDVMPLETSVKPEPIDLEEEEQQQEPEDSKENFQTDLGFDPDGDYSQDGAGGYIDAQMLDDGSMPGSSGFQGGNFSLWEGENFAEYPTDGSQAQQMVHQARDLLASFPTVDSGSINRELKKTLSEPKVHACPFCSSTFPFKSKLDRHLLIHTGERPYACPYCPHRANQKASLKMHMTYKHPDRIF